MKDITLSANSNITTIYYSDDLGILTKSETAIYTKNEHGVERLKFLLKNINNNTLDINKSEIMSVNLVDYGIAKFISFDDCVLFKKDKYEISFPRMNGIFYCIKIFKCNNRYLVFIPYIKGMISENIDFFIKKLIKFLPKEDYDFYIVNTNINHEKFIYHLLYLNDIGEYKVKDKYELEYIFNNCNYTPSSIYDDNEVSHNLVLG